MAQIFTNYMIEYQKIEFSFYSRINLFKKHECFKKETFSEKKKRLFEFHFLCNTFAKNKNDIFQYV